eukprot:GDKJ01015024.1.p1 GENE.GDKJ01015024.1~~GDKJ01015024.1.p1  ORF type:complete len:898 (-),score=323.96 GDKJ01015024.1:94-2604(-)
MEQLQEQDNIDSKSYEETLMKIQFEKELAQNEEAIDKNTDGLCDEFEKSLNDLEKDRKMLLVSDKDYEAERRALLDALASRMNQIQDTNKALKEERERIILKKLDDRRNRRKANAPLIPAMKTKGEELTMLLADKLDATVNDAQRKTSDELSVELDGINQRNLQNVEDSRQRIMRTLHHVSLINKETDAEEVQTLLSQWRASCENDHDRRVRDHTFQLKSVADKLLDRRKRRAKKRMAEEQRSKRSLEDGVLLSAKEEDEEGGEIASGETGDSPRPNDELFSEVRRTASEAQKAAIMAEHMKKIEETKTRHKMEREKLLAQLNGDLDVEDSPENITKALIETFEKEKRKLIAAPQGNDSQEDRQRLLAEFDAHIKALGEVNNSKEALEARLAARKLRSNAKKKAEEELSRKQQIEICEAEQKMIDATDAAAVDALKESEAAALNFALVLDDAVDDLSSSKKETKKRPLPSTYKTKDEVSRVLRVRHEMEMDALVRKYEHKIKFCHLLGDKAQEELEEEFSFAKRELSLKHAQEIADVVANKGSRLTELGGAGAIARVLADGAKDWLSLSASSLASEGGDAEEEARAQKLDALRQRWKEEEEKAKEELLASMARKQNAEIDTEAVLLQEMENKRKLIFEKLKKKQISNKTNDSSSPPILDDLLKEIDSDKEAKKAAQEAERLRQKAATTERLSVKKEQQTHVKKQQILDAKRSFKEKLQGMTAASARNTQLLLANFQRKATLDRLNSVNELSSSALLVPALNANVTERVLEGFWDAVLRREKSLNDAASRETLTGAVRDLSELLDTKSASLAQILKDLSDISTLLSTLKKDASKILN